MIYKDLKVWQKADEFALEIYRITKHFPKAEMYGLTSQLRRAALSVPTNIVEGYARKGDKELSRFINIAIGSLAEVRSAFEFFKKAWNISLRTLTKKPKYFAMKSDACSWSFYKKLC